MCVAAATEHFLPRHSVADVPFNLYFLFIDRRKEARPSGTGMKLRFRTKKRLPATHADVHTGLLHVLVLSRAGRFGAFLAGHVILLRRQNLAPLRFTLTNFFAHFNPRRNILTLRWMPKKSLAFDHGER